MGPSLVVPAKTVSIQFFVFILEMGLLMAAQSIKQFEGNTLGSSESSVLCP
jgi:hypothetical protein